MRNPPPAPRCRMRYHRIGERMLSGSRKIGLPWLVSCWSHSRLSLTLSLSSLPRYFGLHCYFLSFPSGRQYVCLLPDTPPLPRPYVFSRFRYVLYMVTNISNKRPREKTGHLWNEMLEKSSKQDQAAQNQKWGDTRHGTSKTSPTAHQTTTGQVVRTHHTYAYKPTCPPGIQHQVLWLESERKTKKTMERLRSRHSQNSRDVPYPGHPPCYWQTAVSPQDTYRYKREKK